MLTEERLGEVMDAALVAFDRKGIAGVSLDDLAGVAGVSPPDLAIRFPTVEAVLRAVIAHEVIVPMLRASAELPAGGAAEQLRNYCGRAWEIINTRRFAMIYRLLVTEIPLKPWLAEFFAGEIAGPIRRQLENIIASGITRGEFRPVPAASAARAIAGSLVTQAFWCNHLESWGTALCGVPSRVVPETVGLVLSGLHRNSSAALLTTNGDPR